MRFMRLFLASFAFVAASVGAQAAELKNGVDYITLDGAARPDTGKKVEVVEVFMYHCPHCYALEAGLNEWVKKNADKIVFRRMHLGDDPQSHAFTTLETMNALTPELHGKILRAIHVDRNRLNTDASLQEFLFKNGVDKAKYMEMFNSFGVQTKMKRSAQLLTQYKVDSTPSVVIDGRYNTSPSLAGHGLNSVPEAHRALFQVMDALVAKSAAERNKK